MSDKPQERASGVPSLVITQDNEFWFTAAAAGRLVIQRCSSCGVLRHPPAPACASCQSFEWDSIESAGAGTLHSYTVSHYPQDPAFEYPLMVGLIELPEGVRLVADMRGFAEDELTVGLPVQIKFVRHGNGEVLPQLHPVSSQEVSNHV